MTILFTLTPAFNPNDGGVQRTTYKLGKYFTEQGLKVFYFSFKSQGHVLSEYGKLYHSVKEGGANNPENISQYKKDILKIRPDVIINQMPYEASIRRVLINLRKEHNFILLGCLRNSLFSVKNNLEAKVTEALPKWLVPLVNHRIGRWFLFQLHYYKHRKALKAILDTHDKYILLAPPNQDELAFFVGDYQKYKVLAIPNSIPEVYHEKLEKEKIILHVGRLNIPQKRSDLLFSFWQTAHQLLPDWRFIVVGDGPYMQELTEKIQQEKLPRISLEGYQQPESYYQNASIFMMPSAYEGFPNVILEAQSFGLVPIAFSSYPALSWIVADQKDALLSPPFEIDHMVANVVKLTGDQQQLNIMSKAALSNAEQFTIEKVGQQWIALFEELRNQSLDSLQKARS